MSAPEPRGPHESDPHAHRPDDTRHDRPSAPDLAPFRSALISRFPAKDELLRQAATSKRQTRAKRATALVLAGVLVAGVAYVNPAYRREVVATQHTSPQSWQLADGTRLSLDADSRVSIAWRIRSRELTLEHGAAAFDVGASPRPFVVTAGDATIRDIGTLFGVRFGEAGTYVTVVRGEVRVASGTQTAALTANQNTVVADGQVGPVRVVDATADLAWSEGRLVFDGTPLGDAVNAIARYQTHRIVFKDPAAAKLRLSGQYNVTETDKLLRALPAVLPVSVTLEADGTYIIASRR